MRLLLIISGADLASYALFPVVVCNILVVSAIKVRKKAGKPIGKLDLLSAFFAIMALIMLLESFRKQHSNTAMSASIAAVGLAVLAISSGRSLSCDLLFYLLSKRAVARHSAEGYIDIDGPHILIRCLAVIVSLTMIGLAVYISQK